MDKFQFDLNIPVKSGDQETYLVQDEGDEHEARTGDSLNVPCITHQVDLNVKIKNQANEKVVDLECMVDHIGKETCVDLSGAREGHGPGVMKEVENHHQSELGFMIANGESNLSENAGMELMLQQQKDKYEEMLRQQKYKKQQMHKYEAMLRMERKQTDLMESALNDYREAAKRTNASFAEYRKRAQSPEEPLYMPHPDGGGNIILVSEGKKLEEERKKTAIIGMVGEVEAVWKRSSPL